MWSDIPANVQYRWLAEDGHVSVFRGNSNYSNGNTYDGVTLNGPNDGIVHPICANVCFGGAKRNRLFMTASQSLYAVYTGTRGAHFC